MHREQDNIRNSLQPPPVQSFAFRKLPNRENPILSVHYSFLFRARAMSDLQK
jgi:hypothetical protein